MQLKLQRNLKQLIIAIENYKNRKQNDDSLLHTTGQKRTL